MKNEALKNYKLADKLLTGKIDMMFAGVISGNNQGNVWVDDYINPSAALIWSEGLEGFHFVGKPSDNLIDLIEDIITGFLKGKGINYFEFSADSNIWIEKLKDSFKTRILKQNVQYVYSLKNPFDQKNKFSMYEDIISKPLNRDFFNYGQYSNMDFITSYINSYWGSVDNYINSGYGYAALDKSYIVSLAVSSSKYKKYHAIGVETIKDYRNKGIACTLVRMLLKDYIKYGIIPWWDCMESNIASQKVAKKSGLSIDYLYNVYWFEL